MLTKPDMVNDLSGLARLRGALKADPNSREGLKQVASQFEALFTQMMLKSMREASLGDDLFDNSQSNFYRDMYDSQLAVQLAKRQGLGLADMLVKQLGQRLPAADAGTKPAAKTADPTIAGPQAFVQRLYPLARAAAKELNTTPETLLSQAALETGWGRSLMRQPDGTPAHNLFGIKADRRWTGPTVAVPTLEYEGGVAVKKVERFRAYESYAESFSDYVKFMRDNPRYRDALAAGADAQAYFEGLAKGGYATDPAYARKLSGISQGEALRTALNTLKFEADRPLTG
jgi:flagellar protein FlgJ